MKQIQYLLIGLFFLGGLLSYSQGITQDKSKYYEVRKVMGEVNNAYSNFGPSYYGKDQLIFSSPVQRNYIINNIWKPNGQPFLDLFIGKIGKNHEVTDIKNFSRSINSVYHEGDVAFSNNKEVIYFTRDNYYKGKLSTDAQGLSKLKLFRAERKGNKWVNIQPLPFNNDEYSVGHPALSKDGNTLYFISDMPGTKGSTDIFKVSINADGSYGTPENMGAINTGKREMFLFIDGDDLYFSTDGYEKGYGGLDLYVCKLGADGFAATEAVNLGEDINSKRDDFGITIHPEKREGYFSSNRLGGQGDDDIYFFKEMERNVDCTYKVIVTDMDTKAFLEDVKVTFSKSAQKVVKEGYTDDKGEFIHVAPCDSLKQVVIKAEKELYQSVSVTVNEEEKHVYRIALKRVFDKKDDKIMVRINPIYFDYDESFIRPDAAIELDKVVKVMREFPEVLIESGSHTDSRGGNSYNQKLSERRAASTVRYITSKGISIDRITYRGYGEEQLVNGCADGVKCSKEQHQLNRRTEFVIVNPDVLKR